MTTEQENTTAPAPAVEVPAELPKPVNPLLSRVQLPGETFKLPSCGLFYHNGELDPSVTDAEVHVHPMTVIDEIMIKTPDLLFSGEAVQKVFNNCIPQVLKPSELLAKDVDFLLLCLRKVSYGTTLEMETTHWECKHEDPKQHVYPIDITQFIANTKRIDPTSVNREFKVKLPNDQTIAMQPVRFKDYVKLMQAQEQENKMSPEEQLAALVDTLANIIVTVDEVSDSEFIKEWLRVIKPEFLNKLNAQLEKTVHWGPDFTYKVTCKDCGEAQEVVAPLNPLAFFT